MTIVENRNGLIGDFLGTIPAMEALSKKDTVYLMSDWEVRGLLPLISPEFDIRLQGTGVPIPDISLCKRIILDCSTAFNIPHNTPMYMSQAFMKQAELPVPTEAPKATLSFPEVDVHECDYVLSPFARSLPEDQKWPRYRWQQLVESMPDKKFVLIGNTKYDDTEYIKAPNVKRLFNHPFPYICNLLKKSKYGLISVVTGTSHLAFHLGTPNILFNNQGEKGYWGIHPDAITINSYIPLIKTEEVVQKLTAHGTIIDKEQSLLLS